VLFTAKFTLQFEVGKEKLFTIIGVGGVMLPGVVILFKSTTETDSP
jgi:hypothetical protein